MYSYGKIYITKRFILRRKRIRDTKNNQRKQSSFMPRRRIHETFLICWQSSMKIIAILMWQEMSIENRHLSHCADSMRQRFRLRSTPEQFRVVIAQNPTRLLFCSGNWKAWAGELWSARTAIMQIRLALHLTRHWDLQWSVDLIESQCSDRKGSGKWKYSYDLYVWWTAIRYSSECMVSIAVGRNDS